VFTARYELDMCLKLVLVVKVNVYVTFLVGVVCILFVDVRSAYFGVLCLYLSALYGNLCETEKQGGILGYS
jgi:hypothetical protein